MPKKGELGQFADLRWGLARKKGGVFEGVGGLIPQCTLWEVSVVLVVVASGGIGYLHAPVSCPALAKGF